jgi:hypothetical protein
MMVAKGNPGGMQGWLSPTPPTSSCTHPPASGRLVDFGVTVDLVVSVVMLVNAVQAVWAAPRCARQDRHHHVAAWPP